MPRPDEKIVTVYVDGVKVGNVQAVSVRQAVDEPTIVTVSLLVDGKHIKLGME